MYFPARFDHWHVQTGDGWAAHIAGAIGVSTDAQASWWGGKGIGTVPHGLIAAYGGDTVLAATKFADRFADELHVTVLVDFENDSVRTALEVADALGDRLWAVRVDTSETMVDRSLWHEMGRFRPTGVVPELVARSAARSTTPATSMSGSSPPAASIPSASAPSNRPGSPSTHTGSAAPCCAAPTTSPRTSSASTAARARRSAARSARRCA